MVWLSPMKHTLSPFINKDFCASACGTIINRQTKTETYARFNIFPSLYALYLFIFNAVVAGKRKSFYQTVTVHIVYVNDSKICKIFNNQKKYAAVALVSCRAVAERLPAVNNLDRKKIFLGHISFCSQSGKMILSPLGLFVIPSHQTSKALV